MVLIRNPRGAVGGGGGATVTHQKDVLAVNFTTTSLVLVDITGFTITLPTRAAGGAVLTMPCSGAVGVSGGRPTLVIEIGGIDQEGTTEESAATNDRWNSCNSATSDLDGSIIQGRALTNASTLTIFGGVAPAIAAVLTSLEVS